MKLKLEIITLVSSLLSTIIFLAIITNWETIPVETRELFRGGNIGAQIFGVLMLSGFIGILLFIINLINSKKKLWWLRSIGFISYVFLIATIGYYV